MSWGPQDVMTQFAAQDIEDTKLAQFAARELADTKLAQIVQDLEDTKLAQIVQGLEDTKLAQIAAQGLQDTKLAHQACHQARPPCFPTRAPSSTSTPSQEEDPKLGLQACRTSSSTST